MDPAKTTGGNWRTSEPWQDVSNRSILRVQQLSNELCGQLKELPVFDGGGTCVVDKVLFAARDFSDLSESSQENANRWYNFRLCDSYDFAPEIRTWILNNLSKVHALFKAAHKVERTRADFATFEKALRKGSDPMRRAYDQLMIALAVVPYRGVLLQLLENAFFRESIGDKATCIIFQPDSIQSQAYSSVAYSLSGFRLHSEQCLGYLSSTELKAMVFPSVLEEFKEQLEPLFEEFILPFTRGKIPTTRNNGRLFDEDTSDIKGFAVPAYDFYCRENETWQGGMAGWIVVLLNAPPKDFFQQISRDKNDFKRIVSWRTFTQLTRTYVRRVREAHMLDGIEEYADHPNRPSSLEFFRKNLHRIYGWKVSDAPTDNPLVIHWDGAEEKVNVSALTDTIAFDLNSSDCREVAISLRRLCKLFLEQVRRLEGQRLAGESVTFHDYAKDLNALDWQVRHYADEVMVVKKEIADRVALLQGMALSQQAAGELSEINIQSQRLGSPNFDFLLRLRFMMAHLRAQTEGRLYEQPEWCVQFLQSGTRRDIYMVLRALVWLPVGWAQFNKQEAQIAQKELSYPLSWARLFAFEEENDGPIETRWQIGKIIRKLFLQWRITEREFDAFFPAPIVNPGSGWDDQLLWDPQRTAGIDRPAWLPPIRLLPLFVFSMRAAFQHAYLRTIFRALHIENLQALPRSVREEILISSSLGDQPKGAGIHYRIHINFPAPVIPQNTKSLSMPVIIDDLPYGNWKQQMSAYRHIVHPWDWHCEQVPGAVSPQQNDPWHFRIVLEAKA